MAQSSGLKNEQVLISRESSPERECLTANVRKERKKEEKRKRGGDILFTLLPPVSTVYSNSLKVNI